MDSNKPKYTKRLYAAFFAIAGCFFLVEHLYNFGFEYNDFLGHEYLGVLLIAIGIGLGIWSNKEVKK